MRHSAIDCNGSVACSYRWNGPLQWGSCSAVVVIYSVIPANNADVYFSADIDTLFVSYSHNQCALTSTHIVTYLPHYDCY